MIMSKSAPLVPAIFFSNTVFLFKDHFLIVWSMNELSSADSLSGLVVLPEGRECGWGPARTEKSYMGYRSVTSAGLYIKDNSQS
jgi:hypothetical protein